MLAEFKQKLKIEAKKYLEKIEAEVIEGKRGSSYSALKKLGAQSNDIGNNVFTLPAHAEDNLSPQQSADRFADYQLSLLRTFS